ncbi:MAG: YetF domain-containing protein [Tardiphaga sp.]
MIDTIDWAGMFVPENPVLEVMVRGTLIYILLYLVLRFFMNRQAGAVGIPDILVIVLIVESTTDALGKNESVTEAAILIGTVMAWSYGLQWLSFKVPQLEFLINSPKVKLIENGKVLRRNMRRELVTDEELMSLLRTQGIEDPKQVKSAYIEGSGDISVIPWEGQSSIDGHKGSEAMT